MGAESQARAPRAVPRDNDPIKIIIHKLHDVGEPHLFYQDLLRTARKPWPLDRMTIAQIGAYRKDLDDLFTKLVRAKSQVQGGYEKMITEPTVSPLQTYLEQGVDMYKRGLAHVLLQKICYPDLLCLLRCAIKV